MANDATQNTVISAYPTKELFISMLIKDITLRDAIGDLLDNSVDGALRLRGDDSYEGLWVKIELDAENFKIIDNCGGISVEVARNYAFCFGRPVGSEETPRSVGLFGIGMKRALFKLGNKFQVKSIAPKSSFTMEVDVEQWKNNNEERRESDWTFQFDEIKENENNPEDKCGTTITVTELHKDVQESLGMDNDVSELIEELQKEHLYNIDKGLEIQVQGKRLEAKQLELLNSDKIKTAYWENTDSPLQVRIYAGVSEENASNTGWYIFCNNRLVVGPEKMLGWGVKGLIRIPEYHSQFYRFRGCVLLEAENPRYLPWNTAKNGMDEDSAAYKTIFQQIIYLMRSVIDFLNKLHHEQRNYNDGKISDTPLQKALDEAKLQPLNEISLEGVEQKFVSPEPADSQRVDSDTKRITYNVSSERYNAVGKYFGVKRGREVGLRTFDYFYNREIKD